jgi:hypothetical protein
MQAITIGLDLANHWLQVDGATVLEGLWSSEGCVAPSPDLPSLIAIASSADSRDQARSTWPRVRLI